MGEEEQFGNPASELAARIALKLTVDGHTAQLAMLNSQLLLVQEQIANIKEDTRALRVALAGDPALGELGFRAEMRGGLTALNKQIADVAKARQEAEEAAEKKQREKERTKSTYFVAGIGIFGGILVAIVTFWLDHH